MDGIIDNLTSALNTWNAKLAEIWLLLTESPETFKGGDIWQIIIKIHGLESKNSKGNYSWNKKIQYGSEKILFIRK